MTYFDDLEFVLFGDYHHTRSEYEDHYFDYCGIQFIYDGGVTLTVGDNDPVTAEAPVVFFTYPGQSFSYGDKRDHICVCFRGARAERYIKAGLLPTRGNDPFIVPNNPKKLLADLRKLIQHCFIKDEIHHGQAVLELESILLSLKDNRNLGAVSPLKSKILSLANEISYSPCRKWDFAVAGDRLGITATHFRRVFKAVTGHTPREYLRICRMRYAAMLLSVSDKIVKEIACECGYASEFYFSREFKRFASMSPREYKRLNQDNFGNVKNLRIRKNIR